MQVYQQRRQQLMQHVGNDAAVIIAAAPHAARSRDVEYSYRHDSDLYYLCGFREPNTQLVLLPGRQEREFILFCQDRDPEMEIWNGKRAGQAGAKRHYQADVAYSINDVDKQMPVLLENVRRVYCHIGVSEGFDQKLLSWVNTVRRKVRSGVKAPVEFFDLSAVLHEMRLIKSEEEIELMRTAATISATAHRRAMSHCKPGMMEYELEAELEYVFARHGCEPAYASIVGTGANACVLHYVENSARTRPGDMVLIDAGAEYKSYAADITRTFPVDGRFTEPQRLIYEVVLEAQQAAIEKVKPGNAWNEPHDAAVKTITRGLKELGLLKGDVRDLIKKEAYRKFYMHRTGHWLGMDVHDVGSYKINDKWRDLKPGCVLTVEPGIYIAPGTPGVPKKWWNIGVRIEDDLVVTRKGHEVLTIDAPKSIVDIEALVGSEA